MRRTTESREMLRIGNGSRGVGANLLLGRVKQKGLKVDRLQRELDKTIAEIHALQDEYDHLTGNSASG